MEETTSLMTEPAAVLLKEHRRMYIVINALAKRSRQLTLGERPLAYPADGSVDPVVIATLELIEEKIDIVPPLPVDTQQRTLAEIMGEDA